MILVVGGSKGLGLAIAKVYSKKYKVIVLSRSKNEKKKMVFSIMNYILVSQINFKKKII